MGGGREREREGFQKSNHKSAAEQRPKSRLPSQTPTVAEIDDVRRRGVVRLAEGG